MHAYLLRTCALFVLLGGCGLALSSSLETAEPRSEDRFGEEAPTTPPSPPPPPSAEAPRVRFEVMPRQPVPPDAAPQGEPLNTAFPSHGALLRRMRARIATQRRDMIASARAHSESVRSREFQAVPSFRELAARFPRARRGPLAAPLGAPAYHAVHDHFFVRLEPADAGSEGALKLVVRDIDADFATVFEHSLPANWQRQSPRENVQPSHQYQVSVSGEWVALTGIRFVQIFRLDAAGQLVAVRRFDLGGLSSESHFSPNAVLVARFLAGEEFVFVSSRTLVRAAARRYQPARDIDASLPTLPMSDGNDHTEVSLIDGARVLGDRDGNRLVSITRCSLMADADDACSTTALLLLGDEEGPYVTASADGLMLHTRRSPDVYHFNWATAEVRRSTIPACIPSVYTNPCVPNGGTEATYARPDGTAETVELRGPVRHAWPIGDAFLTTVVEGGELWLSTHHLGARMRVVGELRFDGVINVSSRWHATGIRDGLLLLQLTLADETTEQVMVAMDDLALSVVRTGGRASFAGAGQGLWIVEEDDELQVLPR